MVYPVDDHALTTLDLKLVAGRNFYADEIVNRDSVLKPPATLAGAIITQTVARKLSADGIVLGRAVVIRPDGTTAPIIGVVNRLMSAPSFGNSPLAADSMLLPYLWVDSQIFYIVRASPGQLSPAMAAARTELYRISRRRIIVRMQTLREARRESYRADRGLALIMGSVSAILLGVTAAGIVGLTSYWVAQRRRQIGIRRALGATHTSIVLYFLLENFLIVIGGCVAGVVLGIAANLWILQSMAFARLPAVYSLVGVVGMVLLGQIAVVWPALRAASVSPAMATRTV